MTLPTDQSTPIAPGPSLVQWVASNRERTSYIFFGLGTLLVIATIFLGLRSEIAPSKSSEDKDKSKLAKEGPDKTSKEDAPAPPEKHPDYLWTAVWSALVGVTLLGLGFWNFQRTVVSGQETRLAKIVILAAGGASGILTALLGLKLGYNWQDHLMAWLNDGKSKEAGWILGALTIFVVGLALAFLSVQPARDEIRNNVLIRRIVYGYITTLAGLLMLVVLIALNVGVSVSMSQALDMTETRLNSLDEKSERLLRDIHQPIHAYYLGDAADPAMRSLFTNISRVNPEFVGTILDPSINQREIIKLYDRLNFSLADTGRRGWGLILTVGENEENHSFIPMSELFQEKAARPPQRPGEKEQEPKIYFDGEARIMTELQFLAEGKVKPVIYFTQGDGELQLRPRTQRGGEEIATSLDSALVSRNFDVRPLVLSEGSDKRWMKEATVLVILGPRREFKAAEVKLIREYLQPADGSKGGKLFALLPPSLDPAHPDKIGPTGLESLLTEFGVKLPAEQVFAEPRIIQVRGQAIGLAIVPDIIGDPGFLATDNPLAGLLKVDSINVRRSVRPLPGTSTPGFHRQNFLVTSDQLDVWFETAFRQNQGLATFEAMRNDASLRKEKRLGPQMVPVGVLISEDGTPSRPRLAVLGMSELVSDDGLARANRQFNLQLFTGILDWLRERPSNIGIAPRSTETFRLSPAVDQSRLLWMPLGLTMVIIIGLGIGVWLIRKS